MCVCVCVCVSVCVCISVCACVRVYVQESKAARQVQEGVTVYGAGVGPVCVTTV
jgi:hypothetical protein